MIAKYLLSIEEFMDTENGETLLERASLRVDEERRRKAGRMGTLPGRAACLGSGLLLQLAVEEVLQGRGAGCMGEPTAASVAVYAGLPGEEGAMACSGIRIYSATQLLACLEEVPLRQFAYRYGDQGKPYFADLPFYFNLSHSGSYVLCGLSMGEIGSDIQQHCGRDVGRIARRFYSGREAVALEQADGTRERLFYRLWARKEAYGKLTGQGVAGVLGMDLLPWSASAAGQGSRADAYERTPLPNGRCLAWEECGSVENYSIAFCRYA